MLPNSNTWRLKSVTYDEWMNFATRIRHGNLMQSWAYGESKRTEGWMPMRYLLLDSFGNYRGILQVLIKRLYRVVQVARINRGPILFVLDHSEEYASCNLFQTWRAINRHALRSGWWIILAAPETITAEPYVSHLMAKAGFLRRKLSTPWGSIRFSLDQDVENLWTQLNGKWRNLLRKGLKMQVAVLEVNTPNQIDAILSQYERFQIEKGFDGVPKKIMHSLISIGDLDQSAKVYQTLCDETMEVSGFVIISYHFDTAMYLAGWSSPKGREQQANYLLLWQAINAAKMSGMKWFDMGGLNKNTPAGIAHFKKGIGGNYYSNAGEFWSTPIFARILSLLGRR